MARNAISREVVEIRARRRPSSRTCASWWPAPAAANVYETGDLDAGIWTVGTVQGLIHDIPTAGALVQRIVADAEALISERLAGLLGSDRGTHTVSA